MIPKIIHYCWFGERAFSPRVKECIRSWRRVLPDYEIRLWNEKNVDLNESAYIRDAYKTGNYAFVSDYVRMKALEEYGGIYLDVDMEVRKTLDRFLQHQMCLGTDDFGTVETVIMTVPHHPIMKLIMEEYRHRLFILNDGILNKEVVNVVLERFLLPLGYKKKDSRQSLSYGIEIYPSEYFQGRSLTTGTLNITDNTHIIHWHTLLWVSWKTRLIQFLRMNLLVPILGAKHYNRIANKIKSWNK